MMSNTITFYQITDDGKVLNKDISDAKKLGAVTAKIKSNCSILSPSIVMKYDATYVAANYCHIDAPYNRYYFVSPPVLAPGNRMIFACTVDPLMSFRDQILAMNVYVSRKEKQSTDNYAYLADSTLPCTCGNILHTAKFSGSPFVNPEGAGERRYILTVVGGVANDS